MYSKNIRYFTGLLLVCFVFGFIVSLIPVSAVSPFDPEAQSLDVEDRIALYLDAENLFESAEDKLATMDEKITRGNYTLYVDKNTAEVAVKNNLTGQILSTNPYDVASVSSIEVKKELMSQVVVKFEDLANQGVVRTFYSYSESAARGQIEVKNIKNGLRIEYTLGKQTARKLLPRWIEMDRFQTLILDPISDQGGEGKAKTVRSNYSIQNPNGDIAEKALKNMNLRYPCTKKNYSGSYGEKMAIYAIAGNVTEKQENTIEGYIKQYCPHYNYEELEFDHELTEYQGTDKSPAIFRMAVEYYLTEEGLKVVVPANSIRFDEDAYRLSSISVLQYFGASSNDYTGYTFMPDGSGMIIRNEEIMSDGKNSYIISGQIYGADFAYHELTGISGNSEVMRLPIFGVIEDTVQKIQNFDKKVGYFTEKVPVKETDAETGEEKDVYFTSEDLIWIDAFDNYGNIILSVEDYYAQYRYKINEDQTYTVILKGDTRWNTSGFISVDAAAYEDLQKKGLVPEFRAIDYYLMAPLVHTKKYSDEEIANFEHYGIPYDFEGFERQILPVTMLERDASTGKYKTAFDLVTFDGEQVFVYVNEVGEQVEEADRVEGVFKIQKVLWYNGAPAHYDSNVPVNPDDVVIEDKPAAPEGGEEELPGDGTEELPGDGTEELPGDGTEELPGDGTEELPDDGTEELPPEEGEGEEEEKIEYYNNVLKYEEKYDAPAYEEYEETTSQGFLAIITEGDALTRITSEHGAYNPADEASAGRHKYNSVYATFTPRPQDSYRLSDAISVGSSDMWTVVSERKYTGNYTIKFVMLSDATYQNDQGKTESYKYEASYVGMANAYRDYLITEGVLSKLEKVEDDIPLYLELLGATEVKSTVLTIPVMKDTALTSFENIQDMFNKLSTEAGIDNIRARLVGFTKNGMSPLAPSAVKFERVVGGNKGYSKTVDFANSVTTSDLTSSLTIYPDFDFANLNSTGLFDGVSYFYDTVKTIDDRYASKREYSATYQSFQRSGSVCISPVAYEKLYKAFAKKINKLGISGLSFSTLGTDLNSDFNEDDPRNREDTKKLTVELLKKIYENYGKVMIDGGNAYSLGFASDILYMSLDSSRYMRASAAVPFMGILLHGYVNYAGDPTNTAGDVYYETLKIIENGASPYFVLACQHTSAIKESGRLSEYYAVDYNIWYDDMVAIYNQLNDVLCDVQDATITAHEFLSGNRMLTAEEQAEADLIKNEALTGYEEALKKATDEYNARKTLAERHDEEFEEVFEETYDYLKDAETYAEYMYKQFVSKIGRKIPKASVVSVTYTRPDGTTKTFILNYNAEAVEIDMGNDVVYEVAGLGYKIIEG